jgi:hypothetical protein
MTGALFCQTGWWAGSASKASTARCMFWRLANSSFIVYQGCLCVFLLFLVGGERLVNEGGNFIWRPDRSIWTPYRAVWRADRSIWASDRGVCGVDRGIWRPGQGVWGADREFRTPDAAVQVADWSIWRVDGEIWSLDGVILTDDCAVWKIHNRGQNFRQTLR